jgi:PAS domain S-box-containing protein
VIHLAASPDEGVPARAFDAGVTDCHCLRTAASPVDTLESAVREHVSLDADPFASGTGVGSEFPVGTAGQFRYRDLVEYLPDPVFVLGTDGTIRFVNDAIETLTGYPPAELVGRDVSVLVADSEDEDRPSTALLDEDRATGTVEVTLRTAAGESIPTETHLAMLPPDDGVPFRGTVAIVRDITEREETRAQLRTTKQRYRRLVEQNLFGIYIVQDERIEYANPRAAELFGYDADEMVGELSVFDLVAPADHDRLVANIRRRERGETRELQYELTGVRADGSEFEFEVHSARIEHEGEPALLGAVVDITDRKARIEELERYETLIQTVPDSVYALDPDGYLDLHNPAFLDQYDLAQETIDRERLHFTDFVAADDVDRLQEATRRLLSERYDSGGKAVVECTAVTSSGRRFPVENHFTPLYDEDGNLRGITGIARDITEREQRRERLQVLDRVLRHNLRNELGVMIAATDALAERLREEYDDAEYARMARDAVESGRALLDISEEVRRIQSALEHDRIEVPAVDAATVVRDVVDSAAETYPAATIDLDLPASAPVEAGEALELAVEHVIENGIVHNDGEPTVAVSIARDDTDRGEWYEIRVADDGPGIPEQERIVVDEDAEITPLKHGSSLGLWAVTWIVQSYDGSVDIAVDETGTVVTIRIHAAN